MELKLHLQKQIKGSLWSRPPVVIKALSALPGYVFAAEWSSAGRLDSIVELIDKDISYQFEEERTRLHNQESPTSLLDEVRILTEKILKQQLVDQSLDTGIELGALFIKDNELYYFWSGHFGLIQSTNGEAGQKIETLDYFCPQAFVPSRGLGFAGKEGFIFGTMSLERKTKIFLYKDIELNPLSYEGLAPSVDAWFVQLIVT